MSNQNRRADRLIKLENRQTQSVGLPLYYFSAATREGGDREAQRRETPTSTKAISAPPLSVLFIMAAALHPGQGAGGEVQQ